MNECFEFNRSEPIVSFITLMLHITFLLQTSWFQKPYFSFLFSRSLSDGQMEQLDEMYQALWRGNPRAHVDFAEEGQRRGVQPLQKLKGEPRLQHAPVLKVTLYYCHTHPVIVKLSQLIKRLNGAEIV